ncbi:MAG TPA: helix-turn-helix domain-containing protein [Cellvibrio sp.]|nr:helix-turn-helix domain-containing protein [Cellvibrio sp.]
MSIEKGRTNDGGARMLKVLIALRGHSLTGLSNGQLAKSLGESPATINRYLNTLIEAGLATKLPNGLYAHGVQMLQIATAHAHEINRAQQRIDELNQRVQAGAR